MSLPFSPFLMSLLLLGAFLITTKKSSNTYISFSQVSPSSFRDFLYILLLGKLECSVQFSAVLVFLFFHDVFVILFLYLLFFYFLILVPSFISFYFFNFSLPFLRLFILLLFLMSSFFILSSSQPPTPIYSSLLLFISFFLFCFSFLFLFLLFLFENNLISSSFSLFHVLLPHFSLPPPLQLSLPICSLSLNFIFIILFPSIFLCFALHFLPSFHVLLFLAFSFVISSNLFASSTLLLLGFPLCRYSCVCLLVHFLSR